MIKNVDTLPPNPQTFVPHSRMNCLHGVKLFLFQLFPMAKPQFHHRLSYFGYGRQSLGFCCDYSNIKTRKKIKLFVNHP